MKRAGLVALVLLVLGCDDSDKKKELLAKAGVEAGAPSAGPTGVNVLPPAASASHAAAPAKPPKDCGTGDPVIDDPDLEAEIRLKLNKPKDKNPEAITSKDLAKVTSLNLTKKQETKELDPCVLPKMIALRFLYVGKGEYRDLTPIAGLTKLEGLRVSISEVENLKPLEKLTALDQLDIGRTHVRDISALANNVNITELSMDDTQVSDISVLAKLTKLQKLSIKNTLVTDVSPLKDLKNLRVLDVAGTALNNVNLLEPLRAKGLKINTK